MGNIGQVNFHLPFARDNGVTEQELVETITHHAFYTAWPRAMSAMTLAENVFADDKKNRHRLPSRYRFRPCTRSFAERNTAGSANAATDADVAPRTTK